ncbi:pseudouridine synthase [Psychromarinibacter halotolerans]|uniref:Pseudouridine synthase n=1 Tax=Psychromarinibacter halotolerans TaxID=1775175 RepID=A0ABV7GY26_9RHOB|nr:pseudouridine synthase [Psychromarinibacter halotolerans]MDF0598084.1 pseudouridine synthase [Psychromarinibacter halotolerans]
MTETPPPGDRIAKVLARAGIASRRDAERMIEAGRVAVNGKVIGSPALNVTAQDRVTVDGAPLAPPEPPRLWLYNKPTGLVTTAKDEQGRETVFDALPEDMPRVMSVGRLDLNSEGLLLLTNDGGVKRKLELPSTGWLRRYRVRVNGKPDDATLEPLRKGIEIEGERFQAMEVVLDRQQGANAWLTVGIREGRNREIRRAMEAVGLAVNRLIRVSYGPFQLGNLGTGEVSEIKGRVLRDQLGLDTSETEAPGRAPKGKGRPDRSGPGQTKGPRSGPGKPGSGKPASAKQGSGKPGRARGAAAHKDEWQSGKSWRGAGGPAAKTGPKSGPKSGPRGNATGGKRPGGDGRGPNQGPKKSPGQGPGRGPKPRG